MVFNSFKSKYIHDIIHISNHLVVVYHRWIVKDKINIYAIFYGQGYVDKYNEKTTGCLSV